MRLSGPFVLASCVLAGCVVTPPSSQLPVASSSSALRPAGAAESRIFDLINAERRHQGLSALTYNPRLDQMAKIQAQNMARFQTMAHVLPDAQLPTLVSRAQYVGYPFGRAPVARAFPLAVLMALSQSVYVVGYATERLRSRAPSSRFVPA